MYVYIYKSRCGPEDQICMFSSGLLLGAMSICAMMFCLTMTSEPTFCYCFVHEQCISLCN